MAPVVDAPIFRPLDKTMHSKVAFLIPVYNGEDYLSECLNCLLAQTYEHWEAIVVNNASTDSTAQVIEGFLKLDGRFRVVVNSETVDVIENHNVAARHLPEDAKYCKVFHVDDWMAPDCLQRMVALADAYPSAGIVGAWSELDGKTESRIAPTEQSFFSGAEIAKRSLLGEIQPFISPSVLMLRADIVRGREKFYSLDGLHADVDAAYSILADSDFATVQDTLFRIGRHDDSMTSSEAAPLNKNIAHNLELFLKHSPAFLSPPERRARVGQLLDKYYLFLAKCLLRRNKEGFWLYHKDALENLNHPLQRFRLMRVLLIHIVKHPRALARAVKTLLQRP